MIMPEDLKSLQREFSGAKPRELLEHFMKIHGSRIALASSLGAEDQALTHMMLGIDPGAVIFFIDTGRLHQETYDTAAKTMKRYGMRYQVFFPDNKRVEEMTGAHGPNLFYESVALRETCCQVRKVEPLERALSNMDAWVTGLRREQSPARAGLEVIEWDPARKMVKLNPLASWSNEELWSYIREHAVPYNSLHDRNFPSIGCAPCTRAIGEGEDTRAGRWWWEDSGEKECGLHVKSQETDDRGGSI